MQLDWKDLLRLYQSSTGETKEELRRVLSEAPPEILSGVNFESEPQDAIELWLENLRQMKGS